MFHVTAFGFAGCILLPASLVSLLVLHLSHSCLSFCHVDVVFQLSSGIVFHNSQLSRRIGFPSASKCLPLVPSRPADVVSHLSRLAFVLQMWCPHCIRIAVRLPPTTSNGLPGAAHSHFPIASHLLPGCLRDMVLQMPLYWFPWPLHVSPCALCCPARRMSLFTRLPSCVSWCAYTSVRLLTCPLYFQRQKAVGFQFPEAGGASPLLLPSAYVRRVPGSLELCPPLCLPAYPPALSSTLSLALLTALFSTASPTLSPTLCPTLSPSMFPTAPPTLHPAAFSNVSCIALRLQLVPEICFH